MRVVGLNRRQFLRGSVGLLGLSLTPGCASFPFATRLHRTLPRIGVLTTRGGLGSNTALTAFVDGMREQGYVRGRDFDLEVRSSELGAERLPAAAAELVRLPVDLIVVLIGAEAAVHAAKAATSSIPIVMANSGNDPVAEGLVADIGRPGGNITGLSAFSDLLVGTRLELLGATVPRLSQVGVLWDAGSTSMQLQATAVEAAATALGLNIIPLPVRSGQNIASIFTTAGAARFQALLVLWNPLTNAERAHIARLSTEAHVPSLSELRYWADDGGLLAYGPDVNAMYGRSAYFVERILGGARPSDLPIERPPRLDLVINLKTAETLGLAIPPSMIQQATILLQ